MHPLIAKLAAVAYVVSTSIFLLGCGSGPVATFAVHGNFCGPGHPKIPAELPAEEAFAWTASLPAADRLDLVCKAHDLCFMRYGYNHILCNVEFQAAMKAIYPSLR